MRLNTVPKFIWTVYVDGRRGGVFTLREDVRNYKSTVSSENPTAVITVQRFPVSTTHLPGRF